MAIAQPLRTRPATPADAPAIQRLIDAFTADGTLLPRTADFIATNAVDFIVAVATTDRGDQIVGCVHLDEYAPSLAELRSLAVDPKWQGQGVGRALVAATERLARIRGNDALFAVSNDEEFFARFGFSRHEIPELDLERSEVSRYKGVYAKDLSGRGLPDWLRGVGHAA